jgi:hypothetical protein
MENQFKVILLPTNEATNVAKDSTDTVYLFDEPYKRKENSAFQNQHLYLMDTKSPIEVGDWIIANYDKSCFSSYKPDEVLKSGFRITSKTRKESSLFENDFKIIASTDDSLGLPTFHPETIQRYCDNPQLEIADVIYNVGKVDEDGKWGNFTNADSYEEALGLVQTVFPLVRVMLFWKEVHLSDVLKPFDTVTFIPSLEVGKLEATVLTVYHDRVVLFCQDRIVVAGKDGNVYRPYPENKSIDLIIFAQEHYE